MARRVARHGLEVGSWWCRDLQALHRLESPSTRLDPTISNLQLTTLRRNPDLRGFCERSGITPLYMLGYQAIAEGPYGLVRVAALFPLNPFGGGDPEAFALDGDRRSLHRNPPYDNGIEGVSAGLCLYFRNDPPERRWRPENGLVGLFDLARRHLACEHIWREKGYWPVEDAEHGELASPVKPRPELAIPPVSSDVVLR